MDEGRAKLMDEGRAELLDGRKGWQVLHQLSCAASWARGGSYLILMVMRAVRCTSAV